MVARCHPPRDLEVYYGAVAPKTVALNKFLRDLLYPACISPVDLCLFQAAPEPPGMSRKVEEIPAVPPGYFIDAVAEEKSPVIRVNHRLTAGYELSVQINCIHLFFRI